jgi:hypothetical protein
MSYIPNQRTAEAIPYASLAPNPEDVLQQYRTRRVIHPDGKREEQAVARWARNKCADHERPCDLLD